MNLVLFDDPQIRLNLLPFTFTRPVAAIRVGILTIAEKWEKRLKKTASYKTEDYLQEKFPLQSGGERLLINGALCPDDMLVDAIGMLPAGKFLIKGAVLLAARNPTHDMDATNTIEYAGEPMLIDKPWKIFRENGGQIRADFSLLTTGRKSAGVNDAHTSVYQEEDVFVEEGVTIRAAAINALAGPVYLGKNAIIEEGAIIRGPFAMCEGAHLNMGAKMRGDTTIGPYSKAGGEVSNSVIFGFSNKGHDGFMGNSVIGEWCNLGADTNTSNLKNSYDTVSIWSHSRHAFENTGLQFCGLMMGDHSKCGINTMFNTGTVVDVSSNIFGEGFVRQYVPSFSWGGTAGLTTYRIEKALATAARVMARRNIDLDDKERRILESVFSMTSIFRIWERK